MLQYYLTIFNYSRQINIYFVRLYFFYSKLHYTGHFNTIIFSLIMDINIQPISTISCISIGTLKFVFRL